MGGTEPSLAVHGPAEHGIAGRPIAEGPPTDRASGPLRVCHIVSTFAPTIGGVQNATLGLCETLAGRGVEPVVLTRQLPGAPATERISGVAVHRVGLPLMNRVGALTFALGALWKLATELRDCRVLHVQNIDAPLLVALVARWLPRRRVVVTIHGESKIQSKRRRRLGRVRLALMRGVDRFTALTPAVEAALRRIGVDAERIERIPNGIDTASFRPPTPGQRARARRRLGLSGSSRVAACVGRLVPLKRVDLLLEAWGGLDHPDAVLLVIGDGPERRRLERLAAGSDGPEVRFLGFRDDVPTCIQAADLFVLPSASEGLPMSLLEAMAMALPVVATHLPGLRGIVAHERDALLVPVDDARSLRSAIDRLLRSPELRAELGRSARATLRRECDLGAVAQAHAELYRSLAPSAAARDRGSP